MTNAARERRWHEAQERGGEYVCPWCWGGQAEPGRCTHCKRFEVRVVLTYEPQGLRPQPKPGTWATQPQLARAAEEALKRARERNATG